MSAASRRRGAHPFGGGHVGGQGDLGPTRRSGGQGSPLGLNGQGLLCVAPAARAVPALHVARPPGTHAGHHADLCAGRPPVLRPAAIHGARGQGPAVCPPTRLAATRRLVALGCAGTTDPFLVYADEGDLRDRMRPIERFRAFSEFERRRPGNFGGRGGAVHRQACREGLHVAPTEGERTMLQGLLAGAEWTTGRAAGLAVLWSGRCAFCQRAPETEPHILWECPRCELAH